MIQTILYSIKTRENRVGFVSYYLPKIENVFNNDDFTGGKKKKKKGKIRKRF